MAEQKTDWRQVILIWVIGLLAAGQFGKVSLAFEAARTAYARPDSELALIVSAVGLAGVLLGAVAGMGIARLGPKRVLLAALTAAGVLSVVQATLPGFWLLIGLRALEGFAHLALVVASPVLIAAAAAPKDKSIVMALWASFFGVSFALTAQIIPVLDAFGGLPAIFVAHGLAMLTLVPLSWMWLSAARAAPRPWEGLVAAHLAIYRDPARTAPALAFFWHTLMFVALLTFLPEQLAGPVPQPVVAGALPLTALVGTFAAGALARYIHPLRLCLISFATTVLMMLILGLLSGLPQVIWAGLLFVAIGVIPGAAFGAIPALNEAQDAQAEANGAMAQLGNIGTTSGTPIFAIALSWGALYGLTAVSVVLAVLGILTVSWIITRLR